MYQNYSQQRRRLVVSGQFWFNRRFVYSITDLPNPALRLSIILEGGGENTFGGGPRTQRPNAMVSLMHSLSFSYFLRAHSRSSSRTSETKNSYNKKKTPVSVLDKKSVWTNNHNHYLNHNHKIIIKLGFFSSLSPYNYLYVTILLITIYYDDDYDYYYK